MDPATMTDPFSAYIGLEYVELTGSRVVATWAAVAWPSTSAS